MVRALKTGSSIEIIPILAARQREKGNKELESGLELLSCSYGQGLQGDLRSDERRKCIAGSIVTLRTELLQLKRFLSIVRLQTAR